MRQPYILLILILTAVPFLVKGQSLDEAKKWYLEGNFKDAKPIFEDAYNQNPNQADINLWLGVIALSENNLTTAEKYLQFASQKKIQGAYLHLGELYVKTYRFKDAEKEFDKYEKANRRNKDALEKLESQREYADKLEKMVNRTEDIQIIDSVVLSKRDFLEAYHLSSESGTLLPMNQFFKEQSADNMPLFMSEREDKIYFSRKDPERGNKIYSMEKLLGDFGNEKRLSESVNQNGDQAYPFVMTDGLTIYFASTGHGSLGGYDIFVTRYNLGSDSYLTPNHLNMPFNSPFNDYMMVIDEEKGVGWFASDRLQDQDRVCIYTFIPVNGIALLDSDDEDYLSRRAMITSIRESWKPGENYAQLVQIAKQETEKSEKAQKDFEFVINDDKTYFTLDDFRHAAARTLFSRAIELGEKLARSESELNQKREQFANGTKSQSLIDSILALERENESSSREIESLKLRARNEEIRNNF